MPIRDTYTTTEPANATYAYTEIADGMGYVSFKGFNTGSSGAATYDLTQSTLYSNNVETSGAALWTFNTSQFKLPRIMEGTAIVRFSVASYHAMGGISYWYAELQHISGVTATSLGFGFGEAFTVGAGTTIPHNYTLPITIPLTNLKEGDSLRLIITPGGATFYYLAHDPADRDGYVINPASTYPTKLEVFVPFKIDV